MDRPEGYPEQHVMTETPPRPRASAVPRMLSACLVWSLVFFLHVYVVPRMVGLVESMDAELPSLPRAVVRASTLIRQFGLVAAGTGVVAVTGLLALAHVWRSRGCRILANVLLLFGILAAGLILLSVFLPLISLARVLE